MIETRAKTYSVVSSQIPESIREESPLFGEFLEQYYKSQEFQGGPIDLAENLDQYIKNDSFRQQNLVTSTVLDGGITAFDETISVDSTVGFPDRYGYLKIGNEIKIRKNQITIKPVIDNTLKAIWRKEKNSPGP